MSGLFRFSILILTILLFRSCVIEDSNSKKHTPVRYLDKSSKYCNQQYDVYLLDGCEYIVVDAGSRQWGSHKGDCKNPIHLNNGEVHTAN
jgi:hypothetical protein